VQTKGKRGRGNFIILIFRAVTLVGGQSGDRKVGTRTTRRRAAASKMPEEVIGQGRREERAWQPHAKIK